MKTRIVYPTIWDCEGFVKSDPVTKALFFYLVNNSRLGLTRCVHITDRQICFDTNLDFNQLETGKKQLTDLSICFFFEDWIYHNHDYAYVDYDGRDRVQQAKRKEIAQIPQRVIEYFKGLKTSYQPVLNHKSKIINNNTESVTGYKGVSNGLKEARRVLADKLNLNGAGIKKEVNH